jgi:ABC-type transport system substrate-binding protein
MGPSDVRVVIEGYRDLVRVGSGGFSMVYRAHQDAFDRTVAVKVLTVELVDETAQRRFQRECRASGRLSNHPNIVTVLDSGFTEDGRPFITTEFMSNGSLADRLEEHGVYSVPDALDIGVKMCGALAAVHAAGILHRDIKPQNILVSDYGEPALADFGISAITVGPDASIGTSSITPLHVAPEVLEGQPTSQASDVYALGSTIYTLLANRAPFQKDDEDALLPLMRRVVMDPVPAIDRPDMPDVVLDLLRYSMEKQPFARYGTAVAFGEAIQALQAHLGHPVTPLRKPGASTAEIVTSREPPATLTPPTADPLAASPSPGSHAAPTIAAAVAAGAAGAAGSGGGFAPVPTAGSGAGSRSGSGSGSKTALVVGAVGVVVVLALVAAFLATRSSTSSDATTTGPSTRGNGNGNSPTSTGDPNGPPTTIDLSNPATGLRFDMDGVSIDGAAPAPGGVLRVGIDTEPASFNPSTSRFYTGTSLVADAIYEPLTIIQADGPHPFLATKLTPNDTFDEWKIELPSGVSFHDGVAFDAAAVKANLDARQANSLMAPLLEPISGVRVDGDAVEITTREPWPALPVALAGEAGLMASPSTLSGDGMQPKGTGPFQFKSWDPGKKIVVTKNESYRVPDRPYLDEIDFTIIADFEARKLSLKSGETDLIYTSDPVTIDELANDHVLLQAREALVMSIIFETTDPALSDVRLRKALAAAIDRQAISDTMFNGKAEYAASPFPPNSPWAEGKSGQYFDVDAAKQLMDDYTKSKGAATITVTLLVNQSERQHKIAELVQSQWQAIGVETEIEEPDDGDALSRIVDGQYQAALWTYDVPTDPDELYRWFHTDPVDGEYTYNLTRFAFPNLDNAFEKGRSSASDTDRKAAYHRVEQTLVEQAPAVWLAYLPVGLLASPNVGGWDVTTVGGVGRGGTPWPTTLGFKQG